MEEKPIDEGILTHNTYLIYPSPPLQAELKEQDQNILQNFLSVRNSLYSIWETHRMIVKEQEEMSMYENDDHSSPSSVTSPAEKEPLARLGSGLLSSINKYTEAKGITSPLLKKPLVTLEDVQESCPINEDIGPSVCAIPNEATNKPWYEAGSYDTMELPRPGKGSRSYLKNSTKSTSNYKKKEHIYDSIDNVLTEMQQNQGSILGSPNYATLHKWTDKLTSPGSSSNSSSGSNILDAKNSSTNVSVSSKQPVSTSSSIVHPLPVATSNIHPLPVASSNIHPLPVASSNIHPLPVATSNIHPLPVASSNIHPLPVASSNIHPLPVASSNIHPVPVASSNIHPLPVATHPVASSGRRYSSQKRPSSARERKSSSSARSSLREGSHSPPPPTLHNPALASNPVVDVRTHPPSLSDLRDSPTANSDVMARSQSARWPRKKPQASPRSNSPTTSSPSVHKEGFLTPQLSRSVQNGMQAQTNYSYSQNEYDPPNSVCTNFSTEILSSLNFLQQPQSQPGYPIEKKASLGSRTASSSSTHGRRSVPLQSSPSPDLSVNPLGGPKVSPPPENQPSAFCHVPKRGRSYSGTSSYAVVSDKSRSRSGSQNNLHVIEGVLPEYSPHGSGSPILKRSSVSYHQSPSSSPSAMKKDVVNGLDMLAAPTNSSRGDIVDCANSPRFPRRSVNRSTGQSSLYKAPSPASHQSVPSRPRPVFTAPAPPTVPPPKMPSYQPADTRPTNNHLTRPASQKVEQTWC